MKEPGYEDAEAKRIIERAAQIDAEQGRRLDASALRQIALEAGISPAAVDRAMAEHETAVVPARRAWYRAPLITIGAILALLTFFALMRM